MHHYIKCDPDGTPTGHVSKPVALEGYNTAADSAANGKPYLVPATLTNPSFDSATETRSGPVYDAGAGTITYTVSDKPIAGLKALRVGQTKAEAYKRIVAIIPEWKQRNLTARAAELLKIGEGSWTQAEADDWAAGEAIWAEVKTIRDFSDALETNIAGMSVSELKALDVTDDQYWTA